jgi:DNA-binding NarL/FixJ family response regulator
MNRRTQRATVGAAELARVDLNPYRKTDVRYWKSHLIQRRYTDLARPTPGNEYSARIEHEGIGYFFPLGSHDETRAAANAIKIYSTVVRHGWAAACQRFSREITVAVFWGLSPVACTYTTMFTLLHPTSRGPGPHQPEQRLKSVSIIESEEGVKNALEFWINRQSSFRCDQSFTSVKAALNSIRRRAPDMVLVNRNLADLPGGERLETLKSLRPDLPVFSFGVYEESDWIFHSIAGVNAGYYLRRRPPLEWFDPISEAARGDDFIPQTLDRQIRKYFQNLFEISHPVEDVQDAANLTQREREILVCLSKGYQDKEIADVLKISVWTVHGHVKHVFEKLGVHSRTEAVVKYLQK